MLENPDLKRLKKVIFIPLHVKGADIFVTPEYGVQGLDMYLNDSAMFLSLTQNVPNPMDNMVPCDNETQVTNFEVRASVNEILRMLYRQYLIYMLICI